MESSVELWRDQSQAYEVIDILRNKDSHLQIEDRRLFKMGGQWQVVESRKAASDPVQWLYKGDSLQAALEALDPPKRKKS